jgi:hypothetical protein
MKEYESAQSAQSYAEQQQRQNLRPVGGLGALRESYAEPQAQAGRVSEALSRTEKGIECLRMSIGELEARISPVLRPPSPSPTTGAVDAKVNTEPSPLAGGVERLNAQLSDAITYLRAIAARVDF